MNKCYVLANFGGPRNLEEVEEFLRSLLTDKEVIRSNFPQFIHNWIFGRVAKKRSSKVIPEYRSMGNRSPIYEYTETLAAILEDKLKTPVLPFHRYLPQTHISFKKKIIEENIQEIIVFPLFPQFTYATTGSVAKWFHQNLPSPTSARMRWVKSYASHPSFVKAYQSYIQEFLEKNELKEKETLLLFSAHGVPLKFIETGDVYQKECLDCFNKITKAFPETEALLAYQSKFGRGEWVKPYTIDICENILQWNKGREKVVFVPISFTSDHIETLCEIENDYMTKVRQQGIKTYRLPALTYYQPWVDSILEILDDASLCSNQMLIR